jgi:hypothetical protein
VADEEILKRLLALNLERGGVPRSNHQRVDKSTTPIDFAHEIRTSAHRASRKI